MWFNRYKLKTFTCENAQIVYYRSNKSCDGWVFSKIENWQEIEKSYFTIYANQCSWLKENEVLMLFQNYNWRDSYNRNDTFIFNEICKHEFRRNNSWNIKEKSLSEFYSLHFWFIVSMQEYNKWNNSIKSIPYIFLLKRKGSKYKIIDKINVLKNYTEMVDEIELKEILDYDFSIESTSHFWPYPLVKNWTYVLSIKMEKNNENEVMWWQYYIWWFDEQKLKIMKLFLNVPLNRDNVEILKIWTLKDKKIIAIEEEYYDFDIRKYFIFNKNQDYIENTYNCTMFLKAAPNLLELWYVKFNPKLTNENFIKNKILPNLNNLNEELKKIDKIYGSTDFYFNELNQYICNEQIEKPNWNYTNQFIKLRNYKQNEYTQKMEIVTIKVNIKNNYEIYDKDVCFSKYLTGINMKDYYLLNDLSKNTPYVFEKIKDKETENYFHCLMTSTLKNWLYIKWINVSNDLSDIYD